MSVITTSDAIAKYPTVRITKEQLGCLHSVGLIKGYKVNGVLWIYEDSLNDLMQFRNSQLKKQMV